MSKAQLLKAYAEAYELDGGGYICKRRDGRWVVVTQDGREAAG
mgnify:FL=1